MISSKNRAFSSWLRIQRSSSGASATRFARWSTDGLCRIADSDGQGPRSAFELTPYALRDTGARVARPFLRARRQIDGNDHVAPGRPRQSPVREKIDVAGGLAQSLS